MISTCNKFPHHQALECKYKALFHLAFMTSALLERLDMEFFSKPATPFLSFIKNNMFTGKTHTQYDFFLRSTICSLHKVKALA